MSAQNRHKPYVTVTLGGPEDGGNFGPQTPGASTGLQLGDPGSSGLRNNRIEMSFHAPRGVYFDEATRRYTVPENFTPLWTIPSKP